MPRIEITLDDGRVIGREVFDIKPQGGGYKGSVHLSPPNTWIKGDSVVKIANTVRTVECYSPDGVNWQLVGDVNAQASKA